MKQIQKQYLAVPEVAKRSFRRISHVYMCSTTTDPEVYESVIFLPSRQETTERRIVPHRALDKITSFTCGKKTIIKKKHQFDMN